MIEIDDLTVSFGAVRPLDGLSLKIDAPTHGIIGPNGAGKTTLLNAFSGFAGSVTGRITVFGEDITFGEVCVVGLERIHMRVRLSRYGHGRAERPRGVGAGG